MEKRRALPKVSLKSFTKDFKQYLPFLPLVLTNNGLRFLTVSRYKGEDTEEFPLDRKDEDTRRG